MIDFSEIYDYLIKTIDEIIYEINFLFEEE